MHFFLPRLIPALLTLAAVTTAARADDLVLLEQRVRETVLSPRRNRADKLNDDLAALQADGTWSDIPYGATSRTGWKPISHLDRLAAMARAYVGKDIAYAGKPELKAKILKAVDGWIAKNPRCSNWWYNDIAVPQRLGEILLLIHPLLSTEQKEAALKIVANADQGRRNTGTNTGANRVDRAYANILRGIVARNDTLVRESFLAIGDTLTITTAEGIQPDQSFHQHGAQLYMRGYGQVFTAGITRYGALGAGTSYTYTPEQIRTFVDFLLDGLPWFIRGDSIDATAAGRGISRRGNASTIGGLAAQIGKVLTFNNGYRSSELQVFQKRLAAAESAHAADPRLALSGNRYFPYSDVIEHHRPAYAISVKTTSGRTVVPETGNGEGLKNFHLADGVTLIQRTGNEYDEIMPSWDWHRLPGTTTEQANDSLSAEGWSVRGMGGDTGGVSDGTYGASCFNYNRRNVAAKKAWFFFDREMIALGAGIEAPRAKSPVVTSLNQSLLHGPVTYRTKTSSRQTITSGSATPSNLQWVHHDETGYVFIKPTTTTTLRAAAQTGTWSSINSGGDSTPVTCNVFSLDLDHGSAVTNGQYAYTVIPGITAAEMDGYVASNPVRVLSNTPAIQAVKHEGLGITSAIFWNDSPASVGGITSDKKACVMVKNAGDRLEVSVADSTQTNTGVITVTLAAASHGEITADPGVTFTKTPTTVTLTVAVHGSHGKTFRASIPR